MGPTCGPQDSNPIGHRCFYAGPPTTAGGFFVAHAWGLHARTESVDFHRAGPARVFVTEHCVRHVAPTRRSIVPCLRHLCHLLSDSVETADESDLSKGAWRVHARLPGAIPAPVRNLSLGVLTI